MKHTTLALALLLAGASFTSCAAWKKNKKNNNETTAASLSQECPQDLLCTMDYRTIGIAVKQKDGNTVKLDSVKVFLKDKPTEVFKNNMNVFLSDGNYILAEDNAMRLVKKNGSDVVFQGYKQGKVVASKTFLVGHDCCHIKMLSTSNEIIVD